MHKIYEKLLPIDIWHKSNTLFVFINWPMIKMAVGPFFEAEILLTFSFFISIELFYECKRQTARARIVNWNTYLQLDIRNNTHLPFVDADNRPFPIKLSIFCNSQSVFNGNNARAGNCDRWLIDCFLVWTM